jgi:6-phosphogluconolactonase
MKTQTVDDVAAAFCARVQAAAVETIRARGRFAIALSGGGVADLYEALARAAIDWEKVWISWGDERAVPPDHPESNFGLAKRALLDRLGHAPACVMRLHGERPDLTAAARDDTAMLIGALGDPPIFDLIHLGIGPDGHVCSLFPGHPLLGETRAIVREIEDSPKPPPRRLTVTLPLLYAARAILFTARSHEKAAAVRDAIADPASTAPAALVCRRATQVDWILDRPAASLLS